MIPGRYDITIHQRATYTLQVTLPFNLTGHQVIAQVWDDKRRKKYADFDVTVTDAVNGEIQISIDSDATREIKKQGEWDLMVIYANGTKEYWLEGNVTVDPGYTDNLP